jgi:phosphatidylinositol glycan class B
MQRKLTRFRAEALVLVLAALPRLWSAWRDHGVLWPDEIYQSLEQAHRVVFGYGYVPWEYQVGARSWLLPGIFAVVWWPARFAGIASPLVLVGIAKTLVAAISVAGVAGVMRLAGRIGGETARIPAGLLAAALPVGIVFGSRALADPIAGSALVWAWALGSGTPDARNARWAGALLAIAFLLRLQTGIFLGALPALAIARGKRRVAEQIALGAGAVLLAGGVLDAATWGAPFHPIFGFLGAMGGRRGPSDGIWFYPLHLARSSGPAIVILAAGLAASVRKAPVELALLAAFTIGIGLAVPHLAYPNQELRYLLSVLPIACALSGAGLAIAAERLAPRFAGSMPLVAAGAAAVAMLARTATLRVEDLGVKTPGDPRASVWHLGEDVNRLLADAGRRGDLCGLSMTAGDNMIFHGGFTYLHKDVLVIGLWRAPEKVARADVVAAANYALLPDGAAAPPGYELAERRGPAVLWRRDGGCEPHPELSHRLLAAP